MNELTNTDVITDAMTPLNTAGDARRLVLETIRDMRAGRITPTLGMALIAGIKVVNDTINTEIANSKMILLAKKAGSDFGHIVPMGQMKLNG